ncbi:EF-hand calcium-binding domain-containing protein 12 [Rhynchocyon petersi]
MDRSSMDRSTDTYKTLLSSLLGLCQSKTLADNACSSKAYSFNPELVTSHCFKQFEQEDFHLPQSRHRVIILPHREEQLSIHSKAQLQTPPQPISSFKVLEARDIQEQPLDTESWLSQRLMLRKDLESFGNVEKWLRNKPSCTPSEVRVLDSSRKESKAQSKIHSAIPQVVKAIPAAQALGITKKISSGAIETLSNVQLIRTGDQVFGSGSSYKPEVLDVTEETLPFCFPEAVRNVASKKKATWAWHKSVPQLYLPKPPALAALYSYLHSHKIKILEMLNKVNCSHHRKINREEFIRALRMVGTPLNSQEVEDIVIYLSSLGQFNAITVEVLDSTYKQWHVAQQRRNIQAIKKYHHLDRGGNFSQTLPSKSPSVGLLRVPRTSLQKEAQRMAPEEMRDTCQQHPERKQLHGDSECCCLVYSGSKHFDVNCLPSTVPGDMQELINKSHRDTFLVYLQCRKLCESYDLPLTEDIIMRALLYPGDRILLLKDQLCPIRQPGGYYSDLKFGTPNQFLLKHPGTSVAKKTDKKIQKKIKKIHFKEFEELPRKLQSKRHRGHLLTHPNFFWPGHLLDKLQLYLPTTATDRSLALFNHVQHLPSAYPATYHPDHWWPMRNKNYITYGYHDASKIYSVN